VREDEESAQRRKERVGDEETETRRIFPFQFFFMIAISSPCPPSYLSDLCVK
jgi:hypothetical protein